MKKVVSKIATAFGLVPSSMAVMLVMIAGLSCLILRAGATCVNAQELTKQTIYVNTIGIDTRDDLTDEQKTDLKNKIIADIKRNLADAVGEDKVEVTNDRNKKDGASRKVNLWNIFSRPPGTYMGSRMPGSDTGKVYLKEFMDDPRGDAFKTDGEWDMDKLANAIGTIAAHELGHTFSVGHNSKTGEQLNKMTKGSKVSASTWATHNFTYDTHSKREIRKNWGKRTCAASVDYAVKALNMDYWGEPLLPYTPIEGGGLDVLFDFGGSMASDFYFGFLGPDSDWGELDGNMEFDFIYKSSMEGLDADAQIITFFEGWHNYTQFLLVGKPDTSWHGEWILLSEEDLHLENFVTQPDGDTVARLVSMEWDIDGEPGAEVNVILDAEAYGPDSNLYNGFQYGAAIFDPCEGDFDGDGHVNEEDLAVFVEDFGRAGCFTSGLCKSDLSNDGDGDGSDLAIFVEDFGRTDCPYQEISYDINLSAGPASFALPVSPSSPYTAQTLLQDINAHGGTAMNVSRWDVDVNNWHTYVLGEDPGFDIVGGEGYFIGSTNASTFRILGLAVETLTYDFVSGDNFIGVPVRLGPHTAESFMTEVNSQGGAAVFMYRWHEEDWDAHELGTGDGFDVKPHGGYILRCVSASSATFFE